MNNLIFSLNTTMPIFLVMVIGYILKQIGMLNDNFVTVANKFNFKVTLPFMLFRDISTVNIREIFDLKYVLFCALASTVCFWVIWGATKLFVKDKSIRGAFVQSSFRSSAAVMGLAFIENIYGSSAMGPLMIIGAVPLYNIFSVIVLTFEANEDGAGEEAVHGGRIKKAFLNILKNPIILGIAFGMVAALLSLDFPAMVDKTIENVAKMATPLALIALGAGFEKSPGKNQTDPCSICNQACDTAAFITSGGSSLGIYRRKNDCNSDYACITDYTKLLYYGKEHEK